MAAPALSSALPCALALPRQTELSYQGWLPLPCQLNCPQKYWPAQLDWHWSQLVMPYVSSAAPLPLVHWQSWSGKRSRERQAVAVLRMADGERGHSQATQAPRSLTVEVCGAVGCRGGAVSIATAPLRRQDCPPLPPQVSTRLVHLHGSGRHESPSQSAHNRLYKYGISVYSFCPATPARAARKFACMRL